MPLKVIIVDDDATALQVHAAVLEQHGHQVIQRPTALGTTLAILREKPDVVLLDVGMPGLTGDKLARLIAEGDGDPGPIVILHSARPSKELEELAKGCGAAGSIEKTGDPAAFFRRFERIVSLRRAGSRRLRPATTGGVKR